MSRSGYTEDCDDNYIYLYRAVVGRAISGKRGQAFLRELLEALDAMPAKRLIAEDLERQGEVCALGSLGVKRGIDLSRLDPYDPDRIGAAFGIARSLAAEVEYENDEEGARDETPEQRWVRMRAWVAKRLLSAQPSASRDAPKEKT